MRWMHDLAALGAVAISLEMLIDHRNQQGEWREEQN